MYILVFGGSKTNLLTISFKGETMRNLNKVTSLLLGSALSATVVTAADSALQKVMKDRGLNEQDVIRAAKTYNPTGVKDEYVLINNTKQALGLFWVLGCVNRI